MEKATEKATLVMATNNSHKLQEMRQILGHLYNIVGLAEIGCHDDIPETGATLQENALQKAHYVKEHYGYDCFADDTGLEVEALGGAPGVMTARFAGPQCSPADNIRLLLERLDGIDNRRACFRTVIASIQGDKEYTVDGRVDGSIATMADTTGHQGFGYDPVFIPEGHNDTFASMTPEQKNAISHRGRAARAFAQLLSTLK